ncbi:hypothetical protein WAI453_001949 [Rhynchosporium graminicola]
MIHIDHSLLTNAPPSPPKPALPIIASYLLDLEEKQRKRFSGKGRPERLSAGCREVDEVLGGGVERGVVLGISAGVEGKEARLVGSFFSFSGLVLIYGLRRSSMCEAAGDLEKVRCCVEQKYI